MNRSIEAIPTWALCYIINGDASGCIIGFL